MKQRARLGDQPLHTYWCAPHIPAPAESENLIDKVTRTLSGAADLAEVACWRAVRRQLRFRHFRMAENRPDNIVEVVRDATGKSTDRLHAAGLLQASLETGSFLFELFPSQRVHDGVEGHAQQTKFGRFHDVVTPHCVEAEDGADAACAHVRDACPTAQTDGGEGVFVRAGWQPVHARGVDAFPGRA